VTPEIAGRSRGAATIWIAALVPVLLLAGLLVLIVRTDPAERLRSKGTPPVERLAIERATLDGSGITLTVLNDGPDPVTIAQITVDDAFWAFRAEGGAVLHHLARTTLTIPYPWVEGEAHLVKVLTSTGATFEHEIPVAVATPKASARSLWLFALIGIYVGVIPVALGLLWYPLTSRLGPTGLDALLALTIGLLAFLFVDAVHEGMEAASGIPSAYQGVALFVACASAAYLGLEWLRGWLMARRALARTAQSSGLVIALLVAVGIGLHNLGEGLAIGAAYALGEAAFGTLLIIGFTLHNTTEGLAIVAPLGRDRPSLATLVRLGLLGGAPTIAGAWIGGLIYSPVLSVAFLGLGAGAIAQVIGQIARQMRGPASVFDRFASAPVCLGLLAGFGVMYATGLLVG
jgi:zinc transporter, ZIP family